MKVPTSTKKLRDVVSCERRRRRKKRSHQTQRRADGRCPQKNAEEACSRTWTASVAGHSSSSGPGTGSNDHRRTARGRAHVAAGLRRGRSTMVRSTRSRAKSSGSSSTAALSCGRDRGAHDDPRRRHQSSGTASSPSTTPFGEDSPRRPLPRAHTPRRSTPYAPPRQSAGGRTCCARNAPVAGNSAELFNSSSTQRGQYVCNLVRNLPDERRGLGRGHFFRRHRRRQRDGVDDWPPPSRPRRVHAGAARSLGIVRAGCSDSVSSAVVHGALGLVHIDGTTDVFDASTAC